MRSISIRFALAAVAGAMLILALIGTINYHYLKEELLRDATEKTRLIEENSIAQIHDILAQTKETSERIKQEFLVEGFDPKNIERLLTKGIEEESYFFGMAMAFEPGRVYKEPFCPYYYRLNGKIVYKNTVVKNEPYVKEEWYTTPKKAKTAKWSEPYFDTLGGNILMATYGNPIEINGTFIGINTIDLSLEQLKDVISNIHILKSGYAFLLSKEHKILVHPDTSKIMQYYRKGTVLDFNQIMQEDGQRIYCSRVAKTGLILGIVLPENELFASLNKISLISIILAVIGSILLIIIMFLISRRITKPLKEVTHLTEEISLGNFDTKIVLPKQKDEIYDLALSVNRMQEAIKRYIGDLKNATAKEERAQSELTVARSIQMSMLPEELCHNEDIEIVATLKPAKAVGGDFYDFFAIDDEHICFVIADVSGKGVPAAMFMSVTMSYIRAYSQTQKDPVKIVNRLNETLATNNDAYMFVTLFLAIINVKTGEMSYINAGHTEPYVLSPQKGVHALPASQNPIVGAFEGIQYQAESMVLGKEEKLFLFTDGVTEAFSKEDVPFGEKRLEAVLETQITETSDSCLKRVEEAVTDFCEACEQSDDITLLMIAKK